MKQARGVKQISLSYLFSNLVCLCVFEPLKNYYFKILKKYSWVQQPSSIICLWDIIFLE
jgi:hypothetical protein